MAPKPTKEASVVKWIGEFGLNGTKTFDDVTAFLINSKALVHSLFHTKFDFLHFRARRGLDIVAKWGKKFLKISEDS